jgi:hypothetical protein
MAPPKKPTMRDIAKEDRVSPAEALGELLVTAKESMLSAARDIPGELTELDGVPVPARKDIETADAATAWAQEQILKATPRSVEARRHRKGTCCYGFANTRPCWCQREGWAKDYSASVHSVA